MPKLFLKRFAKRMPNWTENVIYQETVLVQNESGVHTRPAGRIAEITNRYPDKIWIKNRQTIVDAKSMLALLQLEARKGDHLEICVEGINGPEIVKELKQLFGDQFNE